MKVEPKTEKEVEEMGLLAPGIYDFAICEATDTVSKKGNDMAAIKLTIDGPEGREFKVLDYLVSIDSMAYKLRHFAESVGLLEQYEKGDMPAEMMEGRTGKCKIAVQPAQGTYRSKNTVADYVPGSKAAETTHAELDDEIPF